MVPNNIYLKYLLDNMGNGNNIYYLLSSKALKAKAKIKKHKFKLLVYIYTFLYL